jgi:hypothetical protein
MKIDSICGIPCKIFQKGDSDLLNSESFTTFWRRIKDAPGYCYKYDWRYCDCEIVGHDLALWLEKGIYEFAIISDDELMNVLHESLYKCIKMEMNLSISFIDNIREASWGVYPMTDEELDSIIFKVNTAIKTSSTKRFK